MILVYRPELDNPPMDKECTIGFSFLGERANTEYIQVKSGVTRDFPENVWTRIKEYDVVKRLLSLGALSIKEDAEAVAEKPASSPEDGDSLASMHLGDAMELIEASFDLEQLDRWDAKDQRIRIKNAIARRKAQLTEGNG